MSVKLTHNSYGKNAVNLSKVIRHKDHHEFRQISVNISLEGDFTTAYTKGDKKTSSLQIPRRIPYMLWQKNISLVLSKRSVSICPTILYLTIHRYQRLQ